MSMLAWLGWRGCAGGHANEGCGGSGEHAVGKVTYRTTNNIQLERERGECPLVWSVPPMGVVVYCSKPCRDRSLPAAGGSKCDELLVRGQGRCGSHTWPA
eukprot:168375-Chlamydomonas_euryale.AAC.5